MQACPFFLQKLYANSLFFETSSNQDWKHIIFLLKYFAGAWLQPKIATQ
jgi:hypothetical protein